MLSAATSHSLSSWQLWGASGGAGGIDEKTGLERLKDRTHGGHVSLHRHVRNHAAPRRAP